MDIVDKVDVVFRRLNFDEWYKLCYFRTILHEFLSEFFLKVLLLFPNPRSENNIHDNRANEIQNVVRHARNSRCDKDDEGAVEGVSRHSKRTGSHELFRIESCYHHSGGRDPEYGADYE